MPKINIKALACGLVLMTAACQTRPAEVRQNVTSQFFFDLKGYFEKEAERLNAAQPRLKKTVAVNGKSEEKTLTEQDYEKELAVFLNADINRPAWLDQYQIDSTLTTGRLQSIRYRATSPKLQVQEIRIAFDQGKVSEIIIDKKADNIVAGSTQHLEYRPETGYQIRSLQETAIAKGKELSISVRFLQ